MRKLLKRIEAALAAIAFAEEGEADTARELLADGDREGTPGAAARRPAPRRVAPRERIARLP